MDACHAERRFKHLKTLLLCALCWALPRPVQAEDASSPHEVDRAEATPPFTQIGLQAGIGFPLPLALEATVKVKRHLLLGAEYSVLPTLSVGPVTAGAWALAGDLRVFPFGGAFFVGGRAGKQRLQASGSVSAPIVGTLTESLAVDTWFLNPRAGFLWTWDSGFTAGIDVGVQIPMASTETSTLPDAVLADASLSSVRTVLGNKVLPTADLLRIGMQF